MHPALLTALQPVLADLGATGAPVPDLVEKQWSDFPGQMTAMLMSPSGGGAGVSVLLDDDPVTRVVRATDQVQEWAVEELWPLAQTNWPVCPRHPRNHPMMAAELDAAAWWVCPADRTAYVRIGLLSRNRR